MGGLLALNVNRTRCSSALIFSDVHCKSSRECRQLLRVLERANSEGVECLVVAGDLFDDLHFRMELDAVVAEMRKIGILLFQGKRIVFTPSMASHDPVVNSSASVRFNGKELTISRVAAILIGDNLAFVTHGDMLLPNGAIAYLFNSAASALGRPLYLEQLTKQRLCGRSDCWLVMGHTHIPGLDTRRKLGNPGAWRSEWHFRLPYWRKPSNSFILCDEGDFRLIFT